MGIFDKLWSKITGHAHAAQGAGMAAAPPAATSSASTSAASTPMAGVAATSSSTPAEPVDVAAIMDEIDAKQSHRSNWRESIVDLMSLLGMDNSLSARRELAQELGYTGDTNDTATMNVWLHKQVMQKMAQNGGKVPQELLN